MRLLHERPALAERAWRRALDAAARTPASVSSNAPIDPSSLWQLVFHDDEEPALCESSAAVATEANVDVTLVRCYAAHVLASGAGKVRAPRQRALRGEDGVGG